MKNKLFKLLSITLILILLGTALASCAPKTEEVAPPEEVVAEPAEEEEEAEVAEEEE